MLEKPIQAPAKPLPAQDLELILKAVGSDWEQLRNQKIFITGGTGFFGCWLLESFITANRALNLNAKATVLTRDPVAFAGKAPHIASDSSIQLIAGDVRTFNFPTGDFPFILHAATEASAALAKERPLEMLTTIVDGTRRVLEFAEASKARKFLLTSSGAVYGVQPSEITHVPESYLGGPDPVDPASVYGEGKRISEQMCVLHAAHCNFECKIARCFAFVGPHLPLDAHFAIGNFLGDIIQGKKIHIGGDGTPMRSYLYAADLAIWLWKMLFVAPAGQAYNVGSDEDLSILDLAQTMVATLGQTTAIDVAKVPVPGAPILRYVPAITKAQKELGLYPSVGLKEAIRRTAEWHGFPVTK